MKKIEFEINTEEIKENLNEAASLLKKICHLLNRSG